MSKKLLTIILALVLVLSVFTACKKNEEAPAEATEKPVMEEVTTEPTTEETTEETEEMEEPAEEEPSSIEFYTHSNENFELVWNQLVEKYTEEFPMRTVNYSVIPSDQFTTQLALIFSSQQEVDIINVHERYAGPYLDLLSEAPDFVAEDMKTNAPDSYAAGMINGKLYGYLYPDVDMMFINKTMFTDAGLEYPTTWEEYITINEQLTKVVSTDAGDVQQYGVDLFLPANFTFTTALWNNIYEALSGKSMLLEDGSVEVNNALGIEATEIFAALSAPDENFLNSFAGGTCAAAIGARWTISYYRAFGVEGLDFEVIPMPVSRVTNEPLGQGYFQMVVVPNYRPEDKQDAAWKFNMWAHNDENNYLLETVAGAGDWREDTKLRISGDDAVVAAGYDAAQYSTAPLIHKDWLEIERIMGTWIEQYLYGQATAEEAMINAQSEIDAIN